MLCLFMLSCLILASSVVTDSIVRRLRSVVAGRPLHPWFVQIVFSRAILSRDGRPLCLGRCPSKVTAERLRRTALSALTPVMSSRRRGVRHDWASIAMIHLLEARVCLEEPFRSAVHLRAGRLPGRSPDILVENRE
jgi:hypothetical protein